MLKDVVVAFGLALLWWFTGIPMSMPSAVAARGTGPAQEG
jgi:hypothetical protein